MSLVCVNGHAMDEGYYHCPSCGAYRPPRCVREGMSHAEQMEAIAAALENDLTTRLKRSFEMPRRDA